MSRRKTQPAPDWRDGRSSWLRWLETLAADIDRSAEAKALARRELAELNAIIARLKVITLRGVVRQSQSDVGALPVSPMRLAAIVRQVVRQLGRAILE